VIPFTALIRREAWLMIFVNVKIVTSTIITTVTLPVSLHVVWQLPNVCMCLSVFVCWLSVYITVCHSCPPLLLVVCKWYTNSYPAYCYRHVILMCILL